MQSKHNRIDHIRHLARLADVRPAELLHLAREAEVDDRLPAVDFLTVAGAAQLERDLHRLTADAHWFGQLSSDMMSV